MISQDLHDFLRDYGAAHPDDVFVVDRPISLDQEITAVVWELAEGGQHPLLRFPNVSGAACAQASVRADENPPEIWRRELLTKRRQESAS